jgi:NitT/TauT family transport system substrate-binding protein
MYYNEYHMLFQAGVDEGELTALYMKDYGCGFPEDGIYCLEYTLRTRPEESKAFVAASLAGWEYASAHREEALDIVMKYVQEVNLPTNRAHMRWMLEKILPTIIPGEENFWELGQLSRNDYRRTVEILKQRELIIDAPSYEIFRGEGIAGVQ